MLYNAPINTIQDIKAFFTFLVIEQKLGQAFHPDTAFEDYINGDYEPVFTEAESRVLDGYMNRCFYVCQGKEDIYGIALGLIKI